MRARPLVRRAVHAASVAAAAAFFVSGLALALVAGPALAQTDAGWDQYQADAARTGNAAGAPAPPYSTAWAQEVDIGAPEDVSGFPMPIIVGDLAVVVGRGSVTAVDVTDGTEAWSVPRALGPAVPAAAAATADGNFIVVTEGGGEATTVTSTTPTPTPPASANASPSPESDLATSSVLLGLDAGTGERRWELPLPALSRTGAAVVGDRAFIGTDGGDVIAVDVTTGDELWTVKAGDEVRLPLAATDDVVLAATVASDASGTSELVALGIADGDEVWRHPPATTGVVVGSPVIGTDAVYVELGDRTVEALELSDGSRRWSATMNQAGGSTPVLVEGSVLAVDALGQVYAFDAADGTRRWDHALNVGVFGPPVAVPGALLVAGDGGLVVALELSSGDLIFRAVVADGFVLGLAAAPDVVVASVTGTSPGVVVLQHYDDGTLVRVPSPTITDAPALLGAWIVAALPAAAVLWLLGRALWTRLGPLEFPENAEVDGEDVEEVDA